MFTNFYCFDNLDIQVVKEQDETEVNLAKDNQLRGKKAKHHNLHDEYKVDKELSVDSDVSNDHQT